MTVSIATVAITICMSIIYKTYEWIDKWMHSWRQRCRGEYDPTNHENRPVYYQMTFSKTTKKGTNRAHVTWYFSQVS